MGDDGSNNNNTTTTGHTIQPYEGKEETKKFYQDWKNRIEKVEKDAKEEYDEQLKIQEEFEKDLEEVGETDITTKTGGISFDPLKGLLFPVQLGLDTVVRYIRYANFIISWEESYIAFWITTACLLSSFVFLFVPWGFIIQWLARIIVWGVFGPWMKLVDIFYVSASEGLTPE